MKNLTSIQDSNLSVKKKWTQKFFTKPESDYAKVFAKGALAFAVLFSACSEMKTDTVDPSSALNKDISSNLTLISPQSSPIIIKAKSEDDLSISESSRATTAPGNDRGRFNITLKFITPVTERQAEVFNTAAARWERIIIGDVPSISGTLPSAFVGFPPVVENGTIDDLIIEVAIAPIDGQNGILGQAGPAFIRTNGGLPISGVMFFDVADLDFLEQLDLFEDVIVHEMGHVLGVGTLWNESGRILREGPANDPIFNGKTANVHWNAAGGNGLLPVENIGGGGTAGSHWRESILNNELMTGFLNLGVNPLSRITAGSMRDLGYKSALVGESYSVPSINARITESAAEGINIAKMETLLAPIGYVETDKK